MTNATIKVPAINAIRDGAASVLKFDDGKAFEIRVAKKSDIFNDRTGHIVANQQPVLVRRDGAKWRGKLHQIATTGASESSLAYMPNFKMFSATGLFAPADHMSDAIVTDKFWRSSVLLFNCLTRELCRRAAAGDDKPFSAYTLMRMSDDSEFKQDIAKAAAQAGANSVAAKPVNGGSMADVMQQLVADLAFCGAIVVPQESAPRGLTTAYRLNAAWREALAAAASINGALPAAEAASEAATAEAAA